MGSGEYQCAIYSTYCVHCGHLISLWVQTTKVPIIWHKRLSLGLKLSIVTHMAQILDALAANDQLPTDSLNLTVKSALLGVVLKQVGLQGNEAYGTLDQLNDNHDQVKSTLTVYCC